MTINARALQKRVPTGFVRKYTVTRRDRSPRGSLKL